MQLIFLLLSGICLGVMTSFNGKLAEHLSIFSVSFFAHLIGAVMLILYIKFIERTKIKLRGAPLYVYFVGFMGVALVASTSFATVKIGATATMSLAIIGQIIMSTIVDHFGLFKTKVVKFNLKQIPSYIIIVIGVLLVVYS